MTPPTAAFVAFIHDGGINMRGISGIGSLSSGQIRSLNRLNELAGEISKNNERISTMKRINSAKDDPSGLIHANLLRSEITAAQEASSNASRASAMLATADSAVGSVLTSLNEARTLALEAAGGTLSGAEIAANQLEIDSILRGINVLAQTEFGGRRLLDGSSGYRATGVDTSEILEVDVLDKRTGDDFAVNINVTTQATRAADS
ncbi:MAG: flagellin [Planctomycetota bacterium]|nr:flagellin [Planctomycetota bacterium]